MPVVDVPCKCIVCGVTAPTLAEWCEHCVSEKHVLKVEAEVRAAGHCDIWQELSVFRVPYWWSPSSLQWSLEVPKA